MDGNWLALTGDVVVGTPHAPDGGEPLWRTLAEAETTFVNLEVPLTRRDEPAEKVVTLRSEPEAAGALTGMGVDVVTLANNHTFDHGRAGLADTTLALGAVDIAWVGAGPDEDTASAPLVRSTASGTVALFGFACTLPAGSAAGRRRPGIAPIRVTQQVSVDPAVAAEQPGTAPFVHTAAFERDAERACEGIAAVRAEVDLVVVGIHWGVPPGWAARTNGVLATYQRPLAHRLVDAGADIVAGHHPHVVHPVERHGDGLVAYSLGNFLFHRWEHWAAAGDGDGRGSGFDAEVPIAPYENPFHDPATLEGTVLLVARSPAGVTCRFLPTVMVDGTPTLADDERADAILDRLTAPPLPDWDSGTTPTLVRERHPELGLLARLDLASSRRPSAAPERAQVPGG